MTTLPLIFAVPTRSLTEIVAVTTQRCARRGRFRFNIGAGHTLTHWGNRSRPVRQQGRMTPRLI